MSAITRDSFSLRVASGIVLIPLVLAATFFGTPYFQALILVAAAVLGREWLGLLGLKRSLPDSGLFFAALAAVLAATLWAGPLQGFWAGIAATAVLAIVYLVRDRVLAPWIVGGLVYVLLPGWSMLWLRFETAQGFQLVLWIFLVVWASDIGGYTVGRALGGPRLLPSVSPNKTWAGLLGAMLFPAGVALVFAGFAPGREGNINEFAATAVFAAIIGAISQFGDMFESGIKRHFSVKDMGTLIPGHGGLFDRVDGLMFVAPAVAALAVLSGEVLPL